MSDTLNYVTIPHKLKSAEHAVSVLNLYMTAHYKAKIQEGNPRGIVVIDTRTNKVEIERAYLPKCRISIPTYLLK